MKYFPLLLLTTCGLLTTTGANANPAPASASDKLVAVDIHGAQRACPVGKSPGWLSDAVNKIQPDVPELASMHKEAGDGVFRLTVDPATGRVSNVTTVKSTGFRPLDDSASDALRRWRWKPGTWKEADVQIFFAKGAKKGDCVPPSPHK
jgi:TonB family protein